LVVLAVSPALLAPDHRQGTEGARSSGQRHDQHAAHPELTQDKQVFFVLRGSHEHLVGDVRIALALAGGDHPRDSRRRGRVDGVPLLEAAGPGHLRWIGVGYRHWAKTAVLGDVDHAPFGQPRHHQTGDVLQGLV
jgi:hypothetical protein